MTTPKAELEVGYWVALTLKPDTATSRVMVGQVEAVTDRGVRVTLIDWLIGVACSWDFYAPWDSIVSALVATPEHDVKGFGEAAGAWQKRMDDGARTPEVVE